MENESQSLQVYPVLALVCPTVLVHTHANTAVIALENPKTSHIIL